MRRATKTLKIIFLRAWPSGKAMNLVTVMVALTLAMVSPALAANGQSFILGNVRNTATTLTRLSGNVAGPALQIINRNAAANATALNISTRGDRPPMRVNSATKVANLNSDKLDGQDSTQFASGTNGKANDSDKLDGNDSTAFLGVNAKAADADRLDGKDSAAFLPSSIYQKFRSVTDTCDPIEGTCSAPVRTMSCDTGDQAIGGGFGAVDVGTTIVDNRPVGIAATDIGRWLVSWQDDASKDTLDIYVICANL